MIRTRVKKETGNLFVINYVQLSREPTVQHLTASSNQSIADPTRISHILDFGLGM